MSEAIQRQAPAPLPRIPKPRAKMGRPRIYTPTLARKVIEAIADGQTIREIEATKGLPCWFTIRKWIIENTDFATQYARAREISAFRLEDMALEASQEATDKDSAARARVIVDAIKWANAHRNPKVYGERQFTEVSGQVEVVHTERSKELRGKLLADLDGAAKPKTINEDGTEVVE